MPGPKAARPPPPNIHHYHGRADTLTDAEGRFEIDEVDPDADLRLQGGDGEELVSDTVPLAEILGGVRHGRTMGSPIALMVRNRDWKNNEVFYAKTVAQTPDNPRAHVNSGNLARNKGDIPTAVRAYKTALQLNPNYTEALGNLAGIYARQGRYDDAIQLMERALQTWADNPQLNRNLGSLYLSTKRYDMAEKYLDKALDIDPDDILAHYFLGLLRIEQKDLSSARPHFERASAGQSELHLSFYYLAVIEKESGNNELARQYARQFLTKDTNDNDLRKTAQAIASGE